MHTFDVYWLWLCLCVLFWFCWLEPKQNSELFGVFLHCCVQESEIILLWKLPLDGKLRSFLLLPGVFLPGRDFGDDDDDDDSKQHGISNTAFDELPVFLFFDFCWPRGSFDFALLSDRICIYCLQRLEGSCMLGIHKNRTETAGVHTSPW